MTQPTARRNQAILAEVASGESYVAVGQRWGISRQRVYQICRRAVRQATKGNGSGRMGQALDLWRQGWSYRAISAATGLSHGRIANLVLQVAHLTPRCGRRRRERVGCHCVSCQAIRRARHQRQRPSRLTLPRAACPTRAQSYASRSWRCWQCEPVYRLVRAADQCAAGHPAPWMSLDPEHSPANV